MQPAVRPALTTSRLRVTCTAAAAADLYPAAVAVLWLCLCSASGQVVLCAYPTGVKIRTLLQKGRTRAGCLGFGSNTTLLCGAKGSGQLLVWDVTQASQAEAFDVHKVSAPCCWVCTR